MNKVDWRIGHELNAEVVEILGGLEMVLRLDTGSTGGKRDLIRVANETQNRPRPGDIVRLRVSAVVPLRFQYVESRGEQRRKGHLDVSI